MVDAAKKALEKAGLTIDDIACVIPHQANVRIIEAIADRLKIPVERVFMNFDRYGNTSAAAVAIALDEANRSGRIKAGDYVLMVVFGGGLTWAGSVMSTSNDLISGSVIDPSLEGDGRPRPRPSPPVTLTADVFRREVTR